MKELFTALIEAQKEIKNPVKNREVPTKSFKFSYADLEEVINAIKPALNKNKLFFIQTVKDRKLTTILGHTSGEAIESAIEIPETNDPKELGSWLTYLRRYSLQMICGIAAEDDNDCEFNKEKQNPIKEGVSNLKKVSENLSILSDAQIKRLFAIAKEHSWFNGPSDNRLKDFILAKYSIASTTKLTRIQYDELIRIIETTSFEEAMDSIQGNFDNFNG